MPAILNTLENLLSSQEDRLNTKRAVLATIEDADERKKISDEIIALATEIGETKANITIEKEAIQSERDENKNQTEAAKGIKPEKKKPSIEVTGPPGEYKGYKFKKELENIKLGNFAGDGGGKIYTAMKNRIKEAPKRTEALVKWFIDFLEYSYSQTKSPAQVAKMKAAMQEGTAGEGGYLVKPEVRTELLFYARDVSIALQDCRVESMTSSSQTFPAENAKASVAITAEESSATESEPTVTEVTLTAKRVDAYSTVSNELIEDNMLSGGIVGLLLPQFIEAVGQLVDSVTFVGTGDPASGVFLSTATTTSVVFSSGSTAFSELLVSNIRSLISKIPKRYLNHMGGRGKFYADQTVLWTYIYGLEDGQNRPIFIGQPYANVPELVYGYPVQQPTYAPSTSGAATGMIVFGNLKGFMIGERLNRINLMVDPYTASKSYQTVFLLFTRWAWAHALNKMYGRIVTAAS